MSCRTEGDSAVFFSRPSLTRSVEQIHSYFNQSICLHNLWNSSCFTCLPEEYFYASSLWHSDCVLGSECFQNMDDLHSALFLNASSSCWGLQLLTCCSCSTFYVDKMLRVRKHKQCEHGVSRLVDVRLLCGRLHLLRYRPDLLHTHCITHFYVSQLLFELVSSITIFRGTWPSCFRH